MCRINKTQRSHKSQSQACVHPPKPAHNKQVKADRIVDTGVDLDKLGIMAAVKTGLAPWASRVHATLDKLNLYSNGGVRNRCIPPPPPLLLYILMYGGLSCNVICCERQESRASTANAVTMGGDARTLKTLRMILPTFAALVVYNLSVGKRGSMLFENRRGTADLWRGIPPEMHARRLRFAGSKSTPAGQPTSSFGLSPHKSR